MTAPTAGRHATLLAGVFVVAIAVGVIGAFVENRFYATAFMVLPLAAWAWYSIGRVTRRRMIYGATEAAVAERWAWDGFACLMASLILAGLTGATTMWTLLPAGALAVIGVTVEAVANHRWEVHYARVETLDVMQGSGLDRWTPRSLATAIRVSERSATRALTDLYAAGLVVRSAGQHPFYRLSDAGVEADR